MSTSTPPPNDAAGEPDETDPAVPADPPRRGAARVRPDADFELMLALRGAARARDLRNRVVRPRIAETRDVAGSTDRAATTTTDGAANTDTAGAANTDTAGAANAAASTDTTSAGSPAVAPNAEGPRDLAHPEGRSG